MAGELALSGYAHVDDAAWRRLALVVPLVFSLWLAMLWALGGLLARAPVPPAPKPIDAQLIELPGEPPPARETEPPPPAPPPKPRQARAVIREPRPAPVPAPQREPQPEVSPPTAAPAPPPPAAPPAPALAAPPQAPAALHAGPTPARAIFNPLPKIPDELRERASSAEALARFDIRADGTASVELVTPTPDPLLNRVILETLRTWRFFPATESGRPIASSQEVRIKLEVR